MFERGKHFYPVHFVSSAAIQPGKSGASPILANIRLGFEIFFTAGKVLQHWIPNQPFGKVRDIQPIRNVYQPEGKRELE